MFDWISEYTSAENITDWILGIVPEILAALLVLLGFWVFYLVSAAVLRRSLAQSDMDPHLAELLTEKIYKVAIVVVAIIMAVDQLGVDVAALLAGIGVIGIALAFAAKDSLSNLIAGLLIFFDKPFAVGDWITSADEYGQVTEVTLRSTRIQTPDNTVVVIPNLRIIDEVLVNKSANDIIRLNASIGIGYGEDIERARKVLTKTVLEMDEILKEPAPQVDVVELGGSSVNLKVRGWVDSIGGQVFDITEQCKVALDEAGIEMPYPHMDVTLERGAGD